ncbi:MAG: hypothetical protein FWD01_04830 [Defluviitaleaceae bacterium]|nr:hypothetical protein [Defluviitaleaceae bacterium]
MRVLKYLGIGIIYGAIAGAVYGIIVAATSEGVAGAVRGAVMGAVSGSVMGVIGGAVYGIVKEREERERNANWHKYIDTDWYAENDAQFISAYITQNKPDANYRDSLDRFSENYITINEHCSDIEKEIFNSFLKRYFNREKAALCMEELRKYSKNTATSLISKMRAYDRDLKSATQNTSENMKKHHAEIKAEKEKIIEKTLEIQEELIGKLERILIDISSLDGADME